jgi:hypothetical protein
VRRNIRRVGSRGVAKLAQSLPVATCLECHGDAHKQGPLLVQENFAVVVLASGWPADTRYGSEMQLRAPSLELTAVVAHASHTWSGGPPDPVNVPVTPTFFP